MRLHFTKRALEELPIPTAARAVYHDASRVGLVFKIEASGHRTFAWYRKVRGRPVWKNLGSFPDLPLEAARQHADELNVKAARWKAGGYEETSPFEQSAQKLTLDSLCEAYIQKKLAKKAKDPKAAAKRLRYAVARYAPELRTRPIAGIRAEEIVEIHTKVGKRYGHHPANGIVEKLKALFGFALKANPRLWHGANPARGHDIFRVEPRDRYLKPDELAALWQALSRTTNTDLRDFVNLSLWCGTRKSDTMGMRWADVSLPDNTWAVPRTTKSGKPYSIPLSKEAVEILEARLARADAFAKKAGIPRSPWVFPSHGSRGRLVSLEKSWNKLLVDAGLDFADQPEQRPRIHDLRRTHGSYLAASGASLPIIAKSLGHTSVGATEIYSRLSIDPIREAMEKSQAVMRAAMHAKPAQLPAPKRQRKAASRA